MRWWLLLVLSCAALPVFGAPAPPHRVLMIHSFGRDFAPFDSVARQFRAELARRSSHSVEFYEISLEFVRGGAGDHEQPLLEFLTSAFRDRKPDLIVPFGGPAMQFCSRHAEALGPGVPMVVAGVDRRRLGGFDPRRYTALATVEIDLPRYMEDMLGLLPALRGVYVVLGTSPLERYWEGELRQQWADYADRVELHWLSGQSIDEMRATVAALPPDAAVFFAILNRDAAGIPHEQESGLSQLRAVANAPIFGYSEEQMGLGIVGGHLIAMKQAGIHAAAAAQAILEGTAGDFMAVESVRPGAPTYDWRELQRWDIPESRLPLGSTVLYRPPSLWQSHRRAVLLAVAVTAMQTGLILLLLAARRRAREMDASLSLAAEAAKVGFWEREVSGDEVRASPRWRALFGLPERGRLRLAEVVARVHPEDQSRVSAVLTQASRDGGSYELECRVVHPDGQIRWISSRGRTDRAGGIQRARSRGASVDITERRRAELQAVRQRDELAHLSRVASLGVLSGSLAHELNQPLGVILANAQAAQRLLKRPQPDLAEIGSILCDIVANDLRAGDVIRRLRTLLQKGQVTRQDVDVNAAVDEVLQLIRSDLIGRGVPVDARLAPALPTVCADPVHLQQILLNLILNACDAMQGTPEGERTLVVTTALREGAIRVSVVDRGEGLPADPEVLFQPFHTTRSHGLGMGLAICRMLVSIHGGRVWAEPNPGRGAAFHVELPLGAAGFASGAESGDAAWAVDSGSRPESSRPAPAPGEGAIREALGRRQGEGQTG